MYVGLVGAKWPESAVERVPINPNRFRADIYEAFTRISESDYWYLPDADEFSKDIAYDYTGKRIAVPSVTLEKLLSQRRSFAEESEAPEELKKAIERSANPLAAFQAEVSRLRLGLTWHNYKIKNIEEEHATLENGQNRTILSLVPSGWSRRTWNKIPSLRSNVMATFATYMTDDEVRSISVPFRAVEAMPP